MGTSSSAQAPAVPRRRRGRPPRLPGRLDLGAPSFNNGITSAGVAADAAPRAARSASPRASHAWKRLLGRFPTIGASSRKRARRSRSSTPRDSVPSIAPPGQDGRRSLPSAAAFADPLLSTGFPLALLGIQRLGRRTSRRGLARRRRFAARQPPTARLTLEEADRSARLVAALDRGLRGFSALRRAVEALLRGRELLGVRAPPRQPHLGRGCLVRERIARMEPGCTLRPRRGARYGASAPASCPIPRRRRPGPASLRAVPPRAAAGSAPSTGRCSDGASAGAPGPGQALRQALSPASTREPQGRRRS